MKLKGTGRIIFWPGGSLWIGRAQGGSDLHAHHAIQIAFGIDAPISLRADTKDTWTPYAGAVIGPDVAHEYLASGSLVANLFLEPESHTGRSLLERFPAHAISPSPRTSPTTSSASFTKTPTTQPCLSKPETFSPNWPA